MLNRRKYTVDGHAWNTMLEMELESLRRGFVFSEGGFAKRGRTPPTPNTLGTGLLNAGTENMGKPKKR